MKNSFVVIMLALISIVMSGAIAIAQDSSGHHQRMEKKDKKETHDDYQVNPVVGGDSLSGQHRKKEVTAQREVDSKVAASMKQIVNHYLHLKNALANDDAKGAAAAGKEIVDAMKKLDKSFLTPEQKKIFEGVEEDAIENAEHISTNAGKIDHQREHFDMLSNDLYDLVKAFGSEQVLYKDYCAMYNNKKGAIWLSETKAIKNPYYGKKMPTCGSVKEEIQ